MDMTIKVNRIGPERPGCATALLSVLDQKDEAAPKGKPTAAAPEPVHEPPAQPAAAPPPAATEPAAGAGRLVTTTGRDTLNQVARRARRAWFTCTTS